MKKISPGFLLPSAAVCVPRKAVRYYERVDKAPEVGDLVYGRIAYLGFHSTLENKQGRIHVINDGSRAVFVFGNRYAPDAFEGVVPRACGDQADMLARSGIVGTVRAKNANVKDPTRVEMLGYVCGKDGKVMNTLHRPMICDPRALEVGKPRARLVLVVGTSMNSGKSMTAAMACWAISAMGHKVRGCKVTGTAGLKDILRMEDAGASPVADFTYFGHPSTYLLSERDVIGIFDKLDRKYANNPSNYWVVEIADGILQRETVCLLASDRVRSRIHRLLFAAGDAMGAIACAS